MSESQWARQQRHWLLTEVHHRRIWSADEAYEIDPVLLDDPDGLASIGFASIEIQHRVTAVNHLPSPANLLGLNVGVCKRDCVFAGKWPVRRLIPYFEIHHQLLTVWSRTPHKTDAGHPVEFNDVSGLLGGCFLRSEVQNPVVALHNPPTPSNIFCLHFGRIDLNLIFRIA